jgi:hypothetical protein
MGRTTTTRMRLFAHPGSPRHRNERARSCDRMRERERSVRSLAATRDWGILYVSPLEDGEQLTDHALVTCGGT